MSSLIKRMVINAYFITDFSPFIVFDIYRFCLYLLLIENENKLELDNHFKPQRHLLFAPHRRHSFPAPSPIQVPTFAAAEKSFYYHFCCPFLTRRGKHEMWSKQSVNRGVQRAIQVLCSNLVFHGPDEHIYKPVRVK